MIDPKNSGLPIDMRPLNCRFRLMDEGKIYPRSACAACGRNIATGLGNECSAVKRVQQGEPSPENPNQQSQQSQQSHLDEMGHIIEHIANIISSINVREESREAAGANKEAKPVTVQSVMDVAREFLNIVTSGHTKVRFISTSNGAVFGPADIVIDIEIGEFPFNTNVKFQLLKDGDLK